ncbi:serine/threonine-protein kinase [Myxococcus qinghaiensis]|uniref:serine/threonine-protein kinase n=1 Tax=Myxococcus qinghaiensis TaxID=2906758 RepID=UPI0020A7AEB0|nr:serine/threonine-protein kinase [Myxococcus qinghaiensis]MCP3163962.1 protein kinase [Myxococcus qinghaiensis]
MTIQDGDEQLLWCALAEGLLTREEVEALREEALRSGKGMPQLLQELGRLSPETLEELRKGLSPQPGPPPVAPVSEETVTVPPARPPADEPHLAGPGAESFPLPGWERYQPLRLLGQGGMGRVFLAWDPRLRRQVALKFVRDESPWLTRRFIAEARAQARVNHERICEVYEVGEVQQRVFIAMRYIDGQPLSGLGRTLPLEQKVMVLRDAALGVHEAHRVGLIHRDLKPSNIMVERDGDGALKTYVMDFGLARDWSASATVEGTLLGTPHYMAPEQARGEHAQLDRRADVYSLGASLYFILTGQPPLAGHTALEVLHQLRDVEPRPPRLLDPTVPEDLEAITLKCLEKDRSARYDSARALAEDLERYLSGEPVRARHGPGYLLRKRLRKHWRRVSLVSAMVLVVAGALGWAALARREAAARARQALQEADERERLARRFTEQVERIESLARYSALARLHDTREDRRRLRERMDVLAAEIEHGGPSALGAGHYALGRGALALGDVGEARRYLESAWAQGFREPRVAHALALVMGQLYRAQLLEAERLRSPEQRRARLSDLERDYREPALAYLRQSQGAEVPAPEYGSALLAFYEGRLDEALGRLDALGTQQPWFHEAPMLRGDILVARATRRGNSGAREEALADFEAARTAYSTAIAIAESLPALHRALGELEYAVLLMELYGQGDVRPAYERGLAAVSRALATAPDDYEAHVLEARFHRRQAEDRGRHGVDVEPLLQKASTVVRQAMALTPNRPEARRELGNLLFQWGQSARERGEDPRARFREALGMWEGVSPGDRDHGFHNQRGLVFKEWAEYEEQAGLPSADARGKAIESYREAIALDARAPEAWINLGIAYFTRATGAHGAEQDADLSRAWDALAEARGRNPRHVVTFFYAGEVQVLMAARRRNTGGDPAPALSSALESYREGLLINPKLPQLHNGVGMALRRQAEDAWERGDSSDALLKQAQASYEQALASAPNWLPALNNLGEVHAVRAWHLRELGKDPGASIRAAVEAYQRATAQAPEHAQPWSNLGAVEVLRAAHALERGLDPGPALARAETALQKATERNPRQGEAWRGLGEARAVGARWKAGRGQGRAEDFVEAEHAFEQALVLEPERHDFRLAFARFCLDWAALQVELGGQPEPILARGRARVEEALAARPDWPEAHAHRAGLLLARTDLAPRQEDEAGKLKAQAQAELEMALSRNPNLVARWSGPRALPRATLTR